ncbi:MAG: SMI1/KNR4 family protein [Abitibacteriaceae bacterium]|nr:SMI1/KNR4 family protein [Abditibacteriaceae bacterium]MBV9867828.1 SMI1/KNR4 family protein [Abditibacteriaceae bacterium]
MWLELIAEWAKTSEMPLETAPPAASIAITALESSLSVTLPAELKAFLKETDGLYSNYDIHLMWPVQRIEQENSWFRQEPTLKETCMPFDSLLFFADAGNGDQFAYAVLNGVVRHSRIYAWNHEDDSRTCIAPSLQWFLDRWLTGNLRV